MLQVAIASAILIGIYRLILPKDHVMDWFAAAVFVAAPAMLGWVLFLILSIAGINPIYASIYYIFYFLAPLYFFKSVEDYSWSVSAKYAVLVPIVAIATEVLILLVVAAMRQ
jgi:hypothetical protein